MSPRKKWIALLCAARMISWIAGCGGGSAGSPCNPDAIYSCSSNPCDQGLQCSIESARCEPAPEQSYGSGDNGGRSSSGGGSSSTPCAITESACGPDLVDTEIQCDTNDVPPAEYECSVIATDSVGTAYCCSPLSACDASDCDAGADASDDADDASSDADDETDD